METEDTRSEAEILAAMKRSWAADAHFFSSDGKEERERWVVQAFLKALSLPFAPLEIKSQAQSSKVDVEFREARFQIKEILNPDSRRTAEIKVVALQVAAAQTLAQTIGPGFVYDMPPITDGYDLVRDKAQELALDARYSEIKGGIDLLIYITRTAVSIARKTARSDLELSETGWRSISCLMGGHAVVLFSQPDAPFFLQGGSNVA